MCHILDMLNLVEAEVQADEIVELVQTLDVGNEVVVEIKFLQRGGDIGGKVAAVDFILAQT